MKKLIVTAIASFVFLCTSVNAKEGVYIENAFNVSNSDGETVLTNRDLKCVAVEKTSMGTEIVRFTLNDYARHLFSDLTRKSIGKHITLSVCGVSNKPKVQAVIDNGVLLFQGPNDYQKECLKSTFELNTRCTDCPVCKN